MRKFLIVFVSMIFGYSNFAFTADAKRGSEENLLFIGNPGSGKSTLINSLIGAPVAHAGQSAGGGLTKVFTSYAHRGYHYIDTPGLADVNIRDVAAIQIRDALKIGGKYRIFFVINLLNSRVKGEDVTTINTVMNAIVNPKNAGYNIVINRLTTKEKKFLLSDPAEMAQVYSALNSGSHKTDSIWYINQDNEVCDDKTEFVSLDMMFRDFIYKNSRVIEINGKEVGQVDANEFEKIKKELTKNIATLQKQMKRQMKEGSQEYRNLLLRMEKVQENARQDQKDLKEELKVQQAKGEAAQGGGDVVVCTIS